MPETGTRTSTQDVRPEPELLFCTARVRMTTDKADRIRSAVRKEVDWIRLIQLALQHETTALLYQNLQRVCAESVPPAILEPLAARRKAQVAEVRHRAGELVRILHALENEEIFAVAYKGPVLAQRLYEDLSLRDFSDRSDLDILIRECDLRRAQGTILQQGYRVAFPKEDTEIGESDRTHRELHFLRECDGQRMLELHWRFMARPARVQGDPEQFLRRFERVRLAGATVRSLPLEVYLLVLSMHATKHKWRKLKLICDIAEILQSPDVDWEFVLREADRLGLRRMLAIGVLLAADPLEVTAPAALSGRLKIDRTSRALAMECRQDLLKEPDESWLKEAEYKFLLHTREHLRDRATIFLMDRLLPRITPDERDRQLITVPESLSALYYLVRPVRMVWDKITE